MKYLLILVILFVLELIYFKIADHFNIIDKPNHRSSHSKITLRGGGIIFPLAVLLAFFFGAVSLWITVAVLAVATVSFIDDIKPLPTLPRFSTHLFAVLIILHELQLFHVEWWMIPICLVFFIGWINAFNFMDGINGITVLYALVALVTFAYLPIHEKEMPLIEIIIGSCLVFGFFNVRKKAKTFAGDVGSISLALILGYFLLKTIVETQQIGYLLFFAVYGIDAAITITHRLLKKENIFEAHRSHLYQYLANEFKYSHILVSVIYAICQLIINMIVIYMDKQSLLTTVNSILMLALLTFVYLIIRWFLIKQMNNKKESLL